MSHAREATNGDESASSCVFMEEARQICRTCRFADWNGERTTAREFGICLLTSSAARGVCPRRPTQVQRTCLEGNRVFFSTKHRPHLDLPYGDEEDHLDAPPQKQVTFARVWRCISERVEKRANNPAANRGLSPQKW
jgi:hypothetical protein